MHHVGQTGESGALGLPGTIAGAFGFVVAKPRFCGCAQDTRLATPGRRWHVHTPTRGREGGDTMEDE